MLDIWWDDDCCNTIGERIGAVREISDDITAILHN